MGLFGSNKGITKAREIELHRKMAHRANELNGEIGSITKEADSHGENFTDVSGKLIEFSEQVMDSLSPEQRAELIIITSGITDLHKSYNNLFRSILDLSSKQTERTRTAIEEYERIGTQ